MKGKHPSQARDIEPSKPTRPSFWACTGVEHSYTMYGLSWSKTADPTALQGATILSAASRNTRLPALEIHSAPVSGPYPETSPTLTSWMNSPESSYRLLMIIIIISFDVLIVVMRLVCDTSKRHSRSPDLPNAAKDAALVS